MIKRLAVLPSSSQFIKPAEPLLVSVKEAARLLGLESQSIRRLARRGDLRYKKISSTKWLINYKSVEVYASKLVSA
jgi:excisionase family DNA binding protein